MTLKYNSKNKQAGFLLKLVTKSAMQKEAGRVQVLGEKKLTCLDKTGS